jgi:hypothetical protein
MKYLPPSLPQLAIPFTPLSQRRPFYVVLKFRNMYLKMINNDVAFSLVQQRKSVAFQNKCFKFEDFALLGNYTANIGNYLPTFWDKLSVLQVVPKCRQNLPPYVA